MKVENTCTSHCMSVAVDNKCQTAAIVIDKDNNWLFLALLQQASCSSETFLAQGESHVTRTCLYWFVS